MRYVLNPNMHPMKLNVHQQQKMLEPYDIRCWGF